ncbi:MAG: DUF4173 domain-containing protein [Chloroflexota bacterium]
MSTKTRLGLACLAAALLIGILGDALLRAVPWGLNVPLWVAAAVAASAGLGCYMGWQGDRRSFFFGGVAVLFAGGLALRDSMALAVCNVLAVLMLLALMGAATARGKVLTAGVTDYAIAALHAGLHAMVGALMLVLQSIAWKEIPRDGTTRQALAVLRGLALAAPLLLVFGGLFVAADVVFEGLVRDFFGFDLRTVFSHLMLTGAVTWIAAGFLQEQFFGPRPVLPDGERPRLLRLGRIETAVVLGLLNALFLAFVLVQLRYLFGGASLVDSSPTLTYSEYARRGFFELVTVAALVLPMLLLADWLVADDQNRRSAIFRVLSATLIVLLFVIMGSALQRMRLYTDELGLTELRLYTTAFMGWLALVFVWFLATVLCHRRERFVFGAMVAGLGVLVTLNAINPDDLIARHNLSRTDSSTPRDIRYIYGLSADAVPAAVESFPTLNQDERTALARRLLQRWTAETTEDWRSWNLGRARARAAVAAIDESIKRDAAVQTPFRR